jgi:type II secretory pathway pseudopilin PulG
MSETRSTGAQRPQCPLRPILVADRNGIQGLTAPNLGPALSGEGGFSLLEVLLAAGLISFLLVGTAEMLVEAIRATRGADQTVSVSGILASQADTLRALPFDSPDLAAGPHEIVIRTVPGAVPIQVAWTVEEETDGLKRVAFRLNREGRPDRSMEAVLLICRDLEPE